MGWRNMVFRDQRLRQSQDKQASGGATADRWGERRGLTNVWGSDGGASIHTTSASDGDTPQTDARQTLRTKHMFGGEGKTKKFLMFEKMSEAEDDEQRAETARASIGRSAT